MLNCVDMNREPTALRAFSVFGTDLKMPEIGGGGGEVYMKHTEKITPETAFNGDGD